MIMVSCLLLLSDDEESTDHARTAPLAPFRLASLLFIKASSFEYGEGPRLLLYDDDGLIARGFCCEFAAALLLELALGMLIPDA